MALASTLEAKPILAQGGWTPLGEGRWARGSVEIWVLGIGPTRSLCALHRCLAQSRPSCLWNIGVAGALKDALSIGEVLEVTGWCSGDEIHPFDRSRDFLGSREGAVCVSLASPLHDALKRDRLEVMGQVVDMEAYGLAFACEEVGLPFRCTKIISDMAIPDDAGKLVERVPSLMLDLWEHVRGELSLY